MMWLAVDNYCHCVADTDDVVVLNEDADADADVALETLDVENADDV